MLTTAQITFLGPLNCFDTESLPSHCQRMTVAKLLRAVRIFRGAYEKTLLGSCNRQQVKPGTPEVLAGRPLIFLGLLSSISWVSPPYVGGLASVHLYASVELPGRVFVVLLILVLACSQCLLYSWRILVPIPSDPLARWTLECCRTLQEGIPDGIQKSIRTRVSWDELLRSVFGDAFALLTGGFLAGSALFHCGTLDSLSLGCL